MKLSKALILSSGVLVFLASCMPPGGDSGGKSGGTSGGFGGSQFIFLLIVGLLVFLLWKWRVNSKKSSSMIATVNPKKFAFIFLGLSLVSIIIFFKFKEWVWENASDTNQGDREARETIKIGEPLILVLICLFLILGGYFLYKSTTKKS
jgi:heme/copper-type cytochrome/quinol oxidase subunit 2